MYVPSSLTPHLLCIPNEVVLAYREATSSLLNLLQTILLQPNALDRNEARGIHRAEVIQRIHRRLLLAVQLLRLAAPAEHIRIAFVQAQPHLAVDPLLREQQRVLDELTLGREVHAVVELVAPVVADELVAEGAHLGVHDEALEVEMGEAENGHGGGVVAAAGLEADEAVLDDVDAADAVGEAKLVEEGEELDRVGVRLVAVDDGNRDTLLELDGDVGGLVGGVERRVGHGPHVVWRGDVGVLEDTRLVAAVCEVGVHGPGLRLCGCDGDVVLLGVVEEVLTALELVAEFGHPPGSDDLDGGLEGVEGELEADLVVALAGAAVGDPAAAFFLSNLDLGTGDDGTGERGTEQVAAFV